MKTIEKRISEGTSKKYNAAKGKQKITTAKVKVKAKAKVK